jgi:hypothetical protein
LETGDSVRAKPVSGKKEKKNAKARSSRRKARTAALRESKEDDTPVDAGVGADTKPAEGAKVAKAAKKKVAKAARAALDAALDLPGWEDIEDNEVPECASSGDEEEEEGSEGDGLDPRLFAAQGADAGYEVDSIIGKRKVEGAVEYLVHWKGYAESFNLWRLESELSCAQAVADYEDRVAQEREEQADEDFVVVKTPKAVAASPGAAANKGKQGKLTGSHKKVKVGVRRNSIQAHFSPAGEEADLEGEAAEVASLAPEASSVPISPAAQEGGAQEGPGEGGTQKGKRSSRGGPEGRQSLPVTKSRTAAVHPSGTAPPKSAPRPP